MEGRIPEQVDGEWGLSVWSEASGCAFDWRSGWVGYGVGSGESIYIGSE